MMGNLINLTIGQATGHLQANTMSPNYVAFVANYQTATQGRISANSKMRYMSHVKLHHQQALS